MQPMQIAYGTVRDDMFELVYSLRLCEMTSTLHDAPTLITSPSRHNVRSDGLNVATNISLGHSIAALKILYMHRNLESHDPDVNCYRLCNRNSAVSIRRSAHHLHIVDNS